MRRPKTADAIKLLHRRYVGGDAERAALLEEERVNAQVARTIRELREEAGLTQKELAELIGTTQSVISRLEDADYEGHSLSMLDRIARALNQRVRVSVNPMVAPAPSGSLFKVGDLVALRSDPSIQFPVIQVVPGGAECRYRVFQNSTKTTYYESQLQAAVVAAEERKTLTVRELHAHLTSLQILSPSTTNLFSLRSGRVRFVPYQYRPVLKLSGDRPRLLIADEVGVGKTIEAGLIIKELRARMDITSVLVICPKALVAERKWLTEMKRFDEHFTAWTGRCCGIACGKRTLRANGLNNTPRLLFLFRYLIQTSCLVARVGKKKDDRLLALDRPPKFSTS